jgi:hypothetical protein
MKDRNGAFGRCWDDLQNVQIAVPVNRGLFESISSAPELSRLGAFGAGGFA